MGRQWRHSLERGGLAKVSRKSDKEISRFIAAYNKSKEAPDRLDAIASIMGWQNEDWASIDDIEMDEEQMRQLKPLDMEEVRHMDPYTIHRHPIYISSSALYSYLRNAWEHLMRHNRQQRRLIWHGDTVPVWQMGKGTVFWPPTAWTWVITSWRYAT